MGWVWVVVALWLMAAPLAVVIGRAIRLRDRREPGSPGRSPGPDGPPLPGSRLGPLP